LAAVRQRIPLFQQPLRHLGHDRRIAYDAARIEGGRHDAAMAPPGFAFTGEEPAAEPRLEQAAADFGLDVVRSVVEQDVTDRARLVENEPAAPENALRDNVGAENFRPCMPHPPSTYTASAPPYQTTQTGYNASAGSTSAPARPAPVAAQDESETEVPGYASKTLIDVFSKKNYLP